MRTVLFICTGNTCRSPLAEGIAQKLSDNGQLPKELGNIFFASAGVAAMDGAPTSEETVAVLERMNAPVPEHAKRLTAAMIRAADLVLGMTATHVARAGRTFCAALTHAQRCECAVFERGFARSHARQAHRRHLGDHAL